MVVRGRLSCCYLWANRKKTVTEPVETNKKKKLNNDENIENSRPSRGRGGRKDAYACTSRRRNRTSAAVAERELENVAPADGDR